MFDKTYLIAKFLMATLMLRAVFIEIEELIRPPHN